MFNAADASVPPACISVSGLPFTAHHTGRAVLQPGSPGAARMLSHPCKTQHLQSEAIPSATVANADNRGTSWFFRSSAICGLFGSTPASSTLSNGLTPLISSRFTGGLRSPVRLFLSTAAGSLSSWRLRSNAKTNSFHSIKGANEYHRQQLCDLTELIALRMQPRNSTFAGDRFNTTQAVRVQGVIRNSPMSPVPPGREYHLTAAQFSGEIAHTQYTNAIVMFLAKQRHRAGFTSRINVMILVSTGKLYDEFAHSPDLLPHGSLPASSLQIGEVKTQCFVVSQNPSARHVRAENLTQRRMHQVRGGVVQTNTTVTTWSTSACTASPTFREPLVSLPMWPMA